MADLDEFRGALRNCSDLQRQALLDLFLKLRDKYAGGDAMDAAVAAAANTLLWSVHDAAKEVAQDRQAMARMLALEGFGATAFDAVSAFDR